MNLDHAIAVSSGDVLQQLQIGFDEMRPALADDAEHLWSFHSHLVIFIV